MPFSIYHSDKVADATAGALLVLGSHRNRVRFLEMRYNSDHAKKLGKYASALLSTPSEHLEACELVNIGSRHQSMTQLGCQSLGALRIRGPIVISIESQITASQIRHFEYAPYSPHGHQSSTSVRSALVLLQSMLLLETLIWRNRLCISDDDADNKVTDHANVSLDHLVSLEVIETCPKAAYLLTRHDFPLTARISIQLDIDSDEIESPDFSHVLEITSRVLSYNNSASNIRQNYNCTISYGSQFDQDVVIESVAGHEPNLYLRFILGSSLLGRSNLFWSQLAKCSASNAHIGTLNLVNIADNEIESDLGFIVPPLLYFKPVEEIGLYLSEQYVGRHSLCNEALSQLMALPGWKTAEAFPALKRFAFNTIDLAPNFIGTPAIHQLVVSRHIPYIYFAGDSTDESSAAVKELEGVVDIVCVPAHRVF
jgi:hypothetical protein